MRQIQHHGAADGIVQRQRSSCAVVRLLLENDADVTTHDKGITTLQKESERGHTAVVRLHLDNVACVNAHPKYDITVLRMASWDGNEVVV